MKWETSALSLSNSKMSFLLRRAEKIQRYFSKAVIIHDSLPQEIKYIAGIDVAYSANKAYGAAVVLEYGTMKKIEEKTYSLNMAIPYIPTFLFLRELPPAITVARMLRTKPDVFMVEGHGRAHPRRFGLACHFGLILNIPTIGVAKSLLYGESRNVKGSWKPIIDKGEIIGAAVLTRKGSKPMYVSVGHKVSLETAVEIVLECSKYRVPEPIRYAHLTAKKAREKFVE
ncbi:endonuclease V [Candidatus Bathyarchaeota archaeon]|nr:MAG: endonuclease V [Candidatus Bathyarchaeota archaeon]